LRPIFLASRGKALNANSQTFSDVCAERKLGFDATDLAAASRLSSIASVDVRKRHRSLRQLLAKPIHKTPRLFIIIPLRKAFGPAIF
jgi:hypothetical protein